MTEIRGTNALCYLGGTKVPLANEWSLDVEQEKIEAPHSFVCPSGASTQWVTRSGGYYSGSMSISALYDDTDYSPITAAVSDASVAVLFYPDCDTVTKYWIGSFWVDVSHSAGVDDYITLDISGESTGEISWIAS